MSADARERLIRYVARQIAGEDWDELCYTAEVWVDALLSEGCRGDLAEAAEMWRKEQLWDWLQSREGAQFMAGNTKFLGMVFAYSVEARKALNEASYERGRRETALKIADAIEATKAECDTAFGRRVVQADADLARSFTEESSDQVKAMLAGATDRLQHPLTPDTSEAVRARLGSSDE